MPAARHGERAGDAVRPGRGRRAAPDAGRLHAALLDHLPRHVARPAPALPLRGPGPPPAPAVVGHLGGVRPVRALVRAAALRLRRQLPHPEVLPGAEQGVGHDGHLGRRACRARAAQLGRRGQARPRDGRRRRRRGRLLVAAQRRAVRVPRRRLVPGGVDGVLAKGVRQPRRLRQALHRVGCHAVVCILKLLLLLEFTNHRMEIY